MAYEPASWEAKFLELYKQSGNVTLAATGCKITRNAVYARAKKYKTFAQLFKEARIEAIEILEATAWSRAKKQSDVLLMFLLKSLKPKMYRENIKVTFEGDLTADFVNKIARQLMELGVESPSQAFQELLNAVAAEHQTSSTERSEGE